MEYDPNLEELKSIFNDTLDTLTQCINSNLVFLTLNNHQVKIISDLLCHKEKVYRVYISNKPRDVYYSFDDALASLQRYIHQGVNPNSIKIKMSDESDNPNVSWIWEGIV